MNNIERRDAQLPYISDESVWENLKEHLSTLPSTVTMEITLRWVKISLPTTTVRFSM